jgi:propanol-preferring alcohol dehydrogenase
VDSAIIFAPAGELVPLALKDLRKGGTVALAGIHLSDVPAMAYEPHLFWEKTLQSVTANTRNDGEALLAEAAAIPVRPRVTRYALADANRALQALTGDRVEGTAVLML